MTAHAAVRRLAEPAVIPATEWALPAGIDSAGVGLLSLHDLAAGAPESPFPTLAESDRLRLCQARGERAGLDVRQAGRLVEVEWHTLRFLRAAALGPPEAEWPSPPPPLPPPRAGVVLAEARWDSFSRTAGACRRALLDPRLPAPRRIATERLSRAALQSVLGSAPTADPPSGGLLSLAGHGRSETFFGDAFETLLSADPIRPRLPPELRGWTVHLLACRCARRLGPALVAAGARGFVGYAGDFVFDPAAPESAFALDTELVLALAAGLPPAAAIAHARAWSAHAAVEECRRGEFQRAGLLAFNAEQLRGFAAAEATSLEAAGHDR